MFDLSGNVIGVVTAVVLPQRVTNGLGFALPADADMLRRVERLKAGLPVEYGFLGIAARSVPGGVQVTRVGEETPAFGKLEAGDVIRAIDGRPIANQSAFVRVVGASPTDRPVAVDIDRRNERRTVSLRLDARTDAGGVARADQTLRWRGITFAAGDDAAIQVRHIDAASPFATTAEVGQTLLQVSGEAVADLPSLLALLDSLPPEQCRLTLDAAPVVVAGTN